MKKQNVIWMAFLFFAILMFTMQKYIPVSEEAGAVKIVSSEQQQSMDTLYWMNGANGLNITRNRGEFKYLGGFNPKNKLASFQIKSALKDGWDISSRQDADDTLEWLLTEGHNSAMLQDYNDMGLMEYSRDEVEALSSGESAAMNLCIYDAVAAYGKNAISAWDYVRAIEVITWSYKVGYYEYDEAMQKCLDIAKELQKMYRSWDDMMTSYIYGFQYWNGDDIADKDSESHLMQQLYEELKRGEDSPYRLDWNMPLNLDYALESKVVYLR